MEKEEFQKRVQDAIERVRQEGRDNPHTNEELTIETSMLRMGERLITDRLLTVETAIEMIGEALLNINEALLDLDNRVPDKPRKEEGSNDNGLVH